MAEAPIIEKRDLISFEAIQDVVDQISARFQPGKIILFGSYADGNPTPDSDVDLLVIMPLEKDKKPIRQAIEISRTLEYRFGGRFGLDLIVRTPGEIARRIKWRDFFILDAIEKGVVLYESGSSGVPLTRQRLFARSFAKH